MGRVLKVQADLLLVGQGLDGCEERGDEFDEVEHLGFEPHLALLEFRQVEEVVDELQQLVAVALHGLHGVPEGRRNTPHFSVEDGFQRGQHEGQGRAQLVIDIGEELRLELVQALELLVGFLELVGHLLELQPAAELPAPDAVHAMCSERGDDKNGGQKEKVAGGVVPGDDTVVDIHQGRNQVTGPNERIESECHCEFQRDRADGSHDDQVEALKIGVTLSPQQIDHYGDPRNVEDAYNNDGVGMASACFDDGKPEKNGQMSGQNDQPDKNEQAEVTSGIDGVKANERQVENGAEDDDTPGTVPDGILRVEPLLETDALIRHWSSLPWPRRYSLGAVRRMWGCSG